VEVAYEEGTAGGSCAQAATDFPAARENITGDGFEGILLGSVRRVGYFGGGRRGRSGEGVLDDLQHLQELVDRGEALLRPVRRGGLHQIVDVLGEAVHQGAGTQSLSCFQSSQQLGLTCGRGSAVTSRYVRTPSPYTSRYTGSALRAVSSGARYASEPSARWTADSAVGANRVGLWPWDESPLRCVAICQSEICRCGVSQAASSPTALPCRPRL